MPVYLMTERVRLTAITTADHIRERLDTVAADLFPQYSRTLLQRWIKSGELTLDGETAKPGRKLAGDEAIVVDARIDELSLSPERMALDIRFEDDAILVLNKPSGLVVHPGAGRPGGTLLNGLLFHDPAVARIPRAGLVHRLDKDTTGLMVVARTLEAYNGLVALLSARNVSRIYEAVVHGSPPEEGVIDQPVGRHRTQRTRMAVTLNGRKAITRFRILERFTGFARLSVALETGRTHQIRVHMQHLGHPLVGDPVYGKGKQLHKAGYPLLSGFARQALHAKSLSFTHPVSGKAMKFTQPLPEDFDALLQELHCG